MRFIIKPKYKKFIVDKIRFPFIAIANAYESKDQIIVYHDERRETFTGIYRHKVWKDIFNIGRFFPDYLTLITDGR